MQSDRMQNNLEHVAIIMDGNGRWAKVRGLARGYGHRRGVKIVEEITEAALSQGIRYLTLYAFSTENWSRPKEEVSELFSLIGEYFASSKEKFIQKGIRVLVLGERRNLSEKVLEEIRDIQDSTRHGETLTLSICFNYGARREIVTAVRNMIECGCEITEETLANHLYTAEIPDPDLIIRTGGEMRLSNFLLYQAAYSEFYFTNTYWPDFTKKDLAKALKSYRSRNRRYGRVSN